MTTIEVSFAWPDPLYQPMKTLSTKNDLFPSYLKIKSYFYILLRVLVVPGVLITQVVNVARLAQGFE